MNIIDSLTIENFEMVNNYIICYAKKDNGIVAAVIKVSSPTIEFKEDTIDISTRTGTFSKLIKNRGGEVKFNIKENEDGSYIKLINMKNLDELEGFKKALKIL